MGKGKTIEQIWRETMDPDQSVPPIESRIRRDANQRYRSAEARKGVFDPLNDKRNMLAEADEEGLDKLNYFDMHFRQLANQDPEMLKLVKRGICDLEILEMEAMKKLRWLMGKEAKIRAQRKVARKFKGGPGTGPWGGGLNGKRKREIRPGDAGVQPGRGLGAE